MPQSQWWYASDNFGAAGVSPLLPTTSAGSEERGFHAAQRCRVIVEGVWVRDDVDGMFKGENDIIVATKFRVGNRPPLDKVHFLESNVPEKRWIPVPFHPEVFATRDFDPAMTDFALEVRVYDEDGLDDDDLAALTSAMSGSTMAAAVAFPALAPYAAFASGAGAALARLVDTLDEHDKLVHGRILLGVNKPASSGYDLFQPGFLICFARDVDASNLLLGQNRQVHTKSSGHGAPQRYEHLSYIVLRITRDGPSSPDMVTNQKMATLIAELELGRKGKSTQALEELASTFEAYTAMKRIERYKQLVSKTDLTREERELLEELGKDPSIRPYLGLRAPQS
jgi:hypothetical protein